MFGSFSNLSKLTPEVIETWARLLHALPESRLLLMDKPLGDTKTRQLLLEQFASQGISGDRLLIVKGAPMKAYLQTYAQIDIVLDPFPRTGGTTTAEALWMGLPVVTLAGQRYVERISASTLMAVGLGDLVTDSRETYIETARSLAQDSARRTKLRDSLRERVSRSELCDKRDLAATIEAAFTVMLSAHSPA